MNDKIYPSMVIRSQAEAIELLEKENQELKEENFNLREYINIDKMSVPYKSDSFEELMTMPTYKKLEQQLDLYKSVLDEIKEYIEELYDNTDDTTCYDIDKHRKEFLLQILDKATEQKW